MSEFTGERVIPGQVDPDLWNEHVARYAFAARRAGGRRVLDAGCGVGYGAARLAAVASRVVGLDSAAEAVEAARRQYARPGLGFLRADCRALPFPDGSLDLVVAFEVFEHLEQPERFLSESRRVLAPSGELVLSTPNRVYSDESRGERNPFHVREFDHHELAAALQAHFPHARVWLQNHAPAVVFADAHADGMDTTIEAAPPEPAGSHFFVAVCSAQPIDPARSFVYLPESGNVLRRRERHIALLESELGQKNDWLEGSKRSLDELHARHQELERESAAERARAAQIVEGLEEENRRKTLWAEQVQAEVERLKDIIESLRGELDQQTQWALKLDAERSEILANYQRLDAEAAGLHADLKTSVDQLHLTEAELAERTRWAFSLDARVRQLTADLNALFGSVAYRAGKRLGLCPEVASDPASPMHKGTMNKKA